MKMRPQRKKMKPKNSKKHFTKHASKVHKKNSPRGIQRGGIRL